MKELLYKIADCERKDMKNLFKKDRERFCELYNSYMGLDGDNSITADDDMFEERIPELLDQYIERFMSYREDESEEELNEWLKNWEDKEQRYTILDLDDEIRNRLGELENSDELLPVLEEAMNYFCSNWDICEGFKHSICETLDDQVNNHIMEQDPKDFRELLDILNGAI